MKIKKSSLEVLFNVLKGTEGVLGLADSRIRDTFSKPLIEAYNEFITDRNKIYDTFALSKEVGDQGVTQYKFAPDKVPNLNKELEVLGNEEVELPNPPQLKDFIEQTEYKPKTGEVEVIDELLTLI